MNNEKSSKWFGWIPTNRGKINFSFISPSNVNTISKNFSSIITSQQVKIKNLNISVISDSNKFSNYRKKDKKNKFNEIASFANIIINNGKFFNGSIEIYNKRININTTFKIKSTGEIEFDGYKSNEFKKLINYEKEIQTVIYIIVKTIVHGDSHHHQKIDIALPVTSDKFDIKIISESFVDYIKLVEKNIKNQKKCYSNLRAEILVSEINGYISYLKTFLLLFDDTKELENDLRYAENIFTSLKATVKKRKIKENNNTSILTAIITFLGLFISINIFMNGFWLEFDNNITEYISSNYSRVEVMGWSCIAILYSFYFYINCTLNSKLYYKWYDGFEVINLIKNSSYKKLNWLGKTVKSIPLLFLILSMYNIITIDNVFEFGFYMLDLLR